MVDPHAICSETAGLCVRVEGRQENLHVAHQIIIIKQFWQNLSRKVR